MMTPEIQSALIALAVGSIPALVVFLQGRAARVNLFNSFAADNLKRVQELRLEVRALRKQMDNQEASHEMDRARWIDERNGLHRRIDTLRERIDDEQRRCDDDRKELQRQINRLVEEASENEITIAAQSETIKQLTAKSEEQAELIRVLQEKVNGEHVI